MSVFILIIALVFAAIVTPVVRQMAIRLNFVAIPKNNRAHVDVTPMMGGVALYVGFVAVLLPLAIGLEVAAADDFDITFPPSELLIVIMCGTLIAAVGLWDDWRALPPIAKLGLQVVPVAMLTVTTPVRIAMPLPEALNVGMTMCWYLYVINAFNYTDNMDGISGMIATVAGMFFMVIAIINDQFMVAALAASVAGVSFGFLRFNLFETRRKIFMGDVGSLFLGFLLATIGLKLTFAAESPWVTWPVPVLVLGVPIFDTAMVFISRIRRGQSFLEGGTDHLSHRFSRFDFGRFGTPFAIGLLCAALGCVALVIMHSSLENSIAAQGLVGVVALLLLYRLEFAAPYVFITGKPRPESQTEPAADPVSEAQAEDIEQPV